MSAPNPTEPAGPHSPTPLGAAAAVASFAQLAEEIATARDAVRQSAVDAGGDRPRGLSQRFAAGWLAAEGGSWSSTARARQTFKETMVEQAHAGSAAYVIGFPGNAYTIYLRRSFGPYDAPGFEALRQPIWKGLMDAAGQAARPVEKVSFLDEVRSWIQGVRDTWRTFRGQHPAYQVGEVLIWLACSAAVMVLASGKPEVSLIGRTIASLFAGLILSAPVVVALLAVVGALRFLIDLLRPATARRTIKDLAWFLVATVAVTAAVEVLFLSIWAVESAVSWFNGTEGRSALELAWKGAGAGVFLSGAFLVLGLVITGAEGLNVIVNRVWPRPSSGTEGATP